MQDQDLRSLQNEVPMRIMVFAEEQLPIGDG